jgi:hypothetical protein
MGIISKIESIIAGFYIYKVYLIVLAVLLFFAIYGVLINWRPYATGGLFSIEWLETILEK